MLSSRQEQILNWIVQDYLELAAPVSSDFITKKHRPKISSATLRIEMKKLTDQGYLEQPHTSAGRIPTDRGYRFFVDRFLKENLKDSVDEKFLKIIEGLRHVAQEPLALFQAITRKLAQETSALTISYFEDNDLWLKEGWQEVLEEPEFQERGCRLEFFKTVENWEKFSNELLELADPLKISIGEEIPFEEAHDFSVIVSRCALTPEIQGFFTILGPKRMKYQKNIELMNSLTKL